ncbi:MAG TPA: cation transporter [Dehalococcoidia bacterium]|nr:cation transporter [Dehalococcoidia bacterium]
MNSLAAPSAESIGLRRLAVGLLWLTAAWNIVEGVVAVASGVAARSVALVGFGLDSFIEVTAALILLWRLSLPDHDERAEGRERAAHRVVGATFIVLAAYIAAQAAYAIAVGDEPDESGIGLLLAVLSLVVMPVLGLTKRRNARRLDSRALIAESTETLVCSYLSLTLFIGLGANAFLGWWWADLAAALAMTPWIVKEGLEGLRGEGCDDDC